MTSEAVEAESIVLSVGDTTYLVSSDNGIGGSKTHLSDFPLETLCENRPGREKKKVASSPPKK
jgi:hypothetical protein